MSHEHGSENWDDMASEYVTMVDEMEPQLAKATHALLQAVALKPGETLLDMACGPGYSTAAAHDVGLDVLGLDLSQAMIDTATRRHPNVKFVVGDMLRPPPGPWHGIISRFGAHHVDPAWAKAAHDILVDQGRIAIAEFDDADEHAHANGMRPAQHWIDLLTQAGFEDVTSSVVKFDTVPQPKHAHHDHQHVPEQAFIVTGRKPAKS